MGHVRFLLSIAALAVLSACAGPHNLVSNNLSTGIGPGNLPAVGRRTVASSTMSREGMSATARPVAKITSASTGDKLIALTFDDGPPPHVFFCSQESNQRPGLGEVLV